MWSFHWAVGCSLFAVSMIHSEILRLDCKRFANFSVSKLDVALQGSLITTLLFKSDKECSFACMMDFQCKSYNKENEGNKRCELNHKTTEDLRDNARLEKRPGWTFMSTDYNDPLLGENCRLRKPCQKDVLCRDTCYCPGYECYPCPKGTIGLRCPKATIAADMTGKTWQFESFDTKNHFFLKGTTTTLIIVAVTDGVADVDSTWQVVPGVCGKGVSFQSMHFPQKYLRLLEDKRFTYLNIITYSMNLDHFCFFVHRGLADPYFVSFESCSRRGYFLQNENRYLKISNSTVSAAAKARATWKPKLM